MGGKIASCSPSWLSAIRRRWRSLFAPQHVLKMRCLLLVLAASLFAAVLGGGGGDDACWNGGSPEAAVVPPGHCVFGADDWSPAPLLSRTRVSDDTVVLTFGLADEGKPLGLSTCACLLARGPAGNKASSPELVVRPYTPVSTNRMLGKFELMVKVYDSETALSKYLGEELEIGQEAEFKHIPFNVKIQYPFATASGSAPAKHVGMIVGGTGVTPMIQALHALLGTPGDTTQVTLLASNKEEGDILAGDTLDRWSADHESRFKVINTLTREPAGSRWAGARGRIGRELIAKHMPPPGAGSDALIFLCGPPGMYDDLAGPRGDAELSGLLKDMGYSAEQVIKF